MATQLDATVDFDRNYRMTIDGELLEGDKTFDVFNPATGDKIAEVPDATEADLERAIARAGAAYPGWAATPLSERQAIEQIDAGTVWINEVHQYRPDQAFGGHKQSGLGCENGLDGLAECTNWQTITLAKS
jgi:acyl-CoA reductase-like NAD-dependent aldehyde dehydrogenase